MAAELLASQSRDYFVVRLRRPDPHLPSVATLP